MATGKFIAYYRVSTAKQGASGLGLEAQKSSVREFLNGGQWQLISEFTEIETGKSATRPQLAQALAMCRLQQATLVVAKLDRLARNLNFLSNLMESGVDFVAADMPSANRLTIHVLAAVSEAEALAISQRTKAALAAAKARGVVLGGNRGGLTPDAIANGRKQALEVRRQQTSKRNADLLPIIGAIRGAGATTLQAIANGLNQRNIPTARVGAWKPMQVSRVLGAF